MVAERSAAATRGRNEIVDREQKHPKQNEKGKWKVARRINGEERASTESNDDSARGHKKLALQGYVALQLDCAFALVDYDPAGIDRDKHVPVADESEEVDAEVNRISMNSDRARVPVVAPVLLGAIGFPLSVDGRIRTAATDAASTAWWDQPPLPRACAAAGKEL